MAQRKNSGRRPELPGGSRGPSATKRGPGRKPVHGEPGARLTKTRKVRASDALMAAWAQKRITKPKHRDERGAYTLTGSVYSVEGVKAEEKREHVLSAGQHADGEPFYTARRKWMAGVSEQRGY